jgi:hypothetical protein
MAADFSTLLGEIQKPAFLPNPGGGGIGGIGGGAGPVTNIPVPGGGGGTAPGVVTNAATGGGSTLCPSFSIWNPFCWGQIGSQAQACVGDFMLRIGLFILGFLCIGGAIYLYKGSGVLAIPSKLARGTVKAGAHVLKAAAQSDE